MKEAALSLVACFALSTFVFPSADRTIRQGSVEFTFGSYDMNESRFEAAYPSGGPIVGLTLSSAVASHLNIYLDIKYYSRHGALTFSQEKTEFYMVPIDLGLRYIFPLGFFLGMPFPLGILKLDNKPRGAIAWAWGMNGLFTVMGGLSSVLLSLFLGFRITILVSILLYIAAFALYSRLSIYNAKG